MRQFLWKGRLFDTYEFNIYQKNISGPNSIFYRASPDEALILSDI
jgi:hypothetical protein